MRHAANATAIEDIKGLGGRVFKAGDRVFAHRRDETDERNKWFTVEGLPGWPTIVCVPESKLQLDAPPSSSSKERGHE